MRKSTGAAIRWGVLCLAFVLAGGRQAKAGQIVGGSSLVTASAELQLEAWLGQGSLKLTNVFTHILNDGKTSADFHNAADGKGPTFSMIEIRNVNGFVHEIIGGYNPRSWNSYEGLHLAYDNAERTAFLFNLTTGLKENEKLGPANDFGGATQTENLSNYGPTFGFGLDIYVDATLSAGSADQFTYVSDLGYGSQTVYHNGELVGHNTSKVVFGIGTIEVFTVAAGTSAVPEPSAFALMGAGIFCLIAGAFRRRRLSASFCGLDSMAVTFGYGADTSQSHHGSVGSQLVNAHDSHLREPGRL